MKITIEKTENGFMIKTSDNILRKDKNTMIIGDHIDCKPHDVSVEHLETKTQLKQTLSEIDAEEHVKEWAELNHVLLEGVYAACYRQGFTDCLRKLEKKIK